MAFGSDQVALYDVDPWNKWGFGVPQFGENVSTLNLQIHSLADEIARQQLFIMCHVDATRASYPSINTVMRLGKCCNRLHAVLANRLKEANEIRTEEGHAQPTPHIWTIHPVPYFNSEINVNYFMRIYNQYVMIALTNMYQHSDNSIPLTITKDFASYIWQYFNEIKMMVGVELLQIPEAEVAAESFVFKDEHYKGNETYRGYHPEDFQLNTEAQNFPSPNLNLPTEDDLYPLVRGIPATIIKPMLKKYPIGPVAGADGISGAPLPDAKAAAGTADASAIGPAAI